MDSQVVCSGIAVAGTLGGSLLTALVAREGKKVKKLEARVDRYKADIRARQQEENIAARLLVELGYAATEVAAKNKLREVTELETGYRPFIEPSEVREHK